MQNKGFTLIELLVVIAIIGILAGIIVVSMGGAQDSAKAARVKATMDQMRAAAALYTTNNGYTFFTASAGTPTSALLSGATCAPEAGPTWTTTLYTGDFGSLCNDAKVGETLPTVSINVDNSAWCAKQTLPGALGTWCVDSDGYAGPIATGCVDGTGFKCQ